MAALALALLQACSAVKLAYNNAPEFGYWWLDGYADFNESQSPKVREELTRLLLWHRTEELPKLADMLQKTQRLASSDLAPAQVCTVFSDLRTRFDAVIPQSEAAAVSLAMSLTPAQILHIERKFTKGNAEWREKWLDLTPTKRIEKRLTSNRERSEEFYGGLDEKQVAVLRAGLEASVFDPQLSYAERTRRQQDLLQTLRRISVTHGSSLSQAEALAALRGVIARSLSSPSPAYRAYNDNVIAESCAVFAKVHNSTTPDQRARAVRRLAAYERDARELSSQK